MKSVILISIHVEGITKVQKLTSKNEPSRAQIEEMISVIYGKTSKTFDLKYVNFQQLQGLKKYNYVVNERYYYTIEVERLDLIEFYK